MIVMGNYWLIEVYNDDTVNVSVTSEEEVQALQKMGEVEEWMFESCDDFTEEEMIERAEDKGFEHDPW